jgi:Domain of unknown function (DUF4129)
MTRGMRFAVAGCALTALLAVVAVASRAHRPGGGTTASTPHAPTLLFDYVASAMLVLFPIGVMIVIWAMAQGRHQRLLAGETNWVRTLTTVAVLCAFLAAAVYLNKHRSHGSRAGGSQQTQTTQGKPAKSGKSPKDEAAAHNPQFQWVSAVIVASIILGIAGAGVALYIRSRRGGDEWAREAALAAALDEILADSLDDLRNEPDPRRAVIRAYARMERTFAAYGVPRDESEAPLEYMARALDRLNVSAYSLRRLTQLFSRAKFSPHEVDVGMKDEAIEALVGLRAELEHNREEAAAA